MLRGEGVVGDVGEDEAEEEGLGRRQGKGVENPRDGPTDWDGVDARGRPIFRSDDDGADGALVGPGETDPVLFALAQFDAKRLLLLCGERRGDEDSGARAL